MSRECSYSSRLHLPFIVYFQSSPSVRYINRFAQNKTGRVTQTANLRRRSTLLLARPCGNVKHVFRQTDSNGSITQRGAIHHHHPHRHVRKNTIGFTSTDLSVVWCRNFDDSKLHRQSALWSTVSLNREDTA